MDFILAKSLSGIKIINTGLLPNKQAQTIVTPASTRLKFQSGTASPNSM